MKKIISLILLFLSTAASAHCPNVPVCEMKAIDILLPETTLIDSELERVNRMRIEGQLLYNEGREQEAARVLKEAHKILKDSKLQK
jgi:hypothetical protein